VCSGVSYITSRKLAFRAGLWPAATSNAPRSALWPAEGRQEGRCRFFPGRPSALHDGMSLTLALLCRKACKAIIAFTSPIPHFLDCTMDDVQKVFGDNAGFVVAPIRIKEDTDGEASDSGCDPKDLTLVDSVIESYHDTLRTAISKNPTWRARLSSYWTLGGGDKQVAEKYWSYEAKLKKQAEGEAIELEFVKEIMVSLNKWLVGKSKLRTGGCQILLERLTSWVLSVDTTDAPLEVPLSARSHH
jgi:hypothetical protein